MKTLAYTTSRISWQFVKSAIEMLNKPQSEIKTIDFNEEAISCAILGCTSLEAFSNEISSLSNAFLYDFKRDFNIKNLPAKQITKLGIGLNKCQKISQIRDSKKESFYERYKNLLSYIGIAKPEFLQELHHLHVLRNALVHFRKCDISVIEDTDGVIRYYQEPPEVFQHIKSYKVKGRPVVASDVDDNIGWNLRISTNAMAVWSLKLILEAILYVLNNLPHGRYKDFILKHYRDRKNSNLFESGYYEIQVLENKILKVDLITPPLPHGVL